MRRPLLDAVGGLDPAKQPQEIDDGAMLDRIRVGAESHEVADVTHLVPRPHSRPALRIAMGAALSTILAVALVLVFTQRGPVAYADWQPDPTTLPTTTEAANLCPDAEPGPPPIPIEPVLAEQRGSYTFVVLAGEGTFSECLVSTAQPELFAMAQGTTPADAQAFDLGEVPVLVLSPGTTWGDEAGEGPITTVIGLAAPDVTGVQVGTSDGTTAQASVSDGWWTVWFPGAVDIADDLLITTLEGDRTLSLSGLTAPGLG